MGKYSYFGKENTQEADFFCCFEVVEVGIHVYLVFWQCIHFSYAYLIAVWRTLKGKRFNAKHKKRTHVSNEHEMGAHNRG